jgi:hypothetical protein
MISVENYLLLSIEFHADLLHRSQNQRNEY